MPRIAHLAARKSIVAASREMNRLGINQGTSGNIGQRIPGGFLVTPTGIPADELEPHMIVRMGFDGRLTPYIVNISLKDSELLFDLRRMVWGLGAAWQEGAASRLDVRTAVIALLREHGRPMTTDEELEHLNKKQKLFELRVAVQPRSLRMPLEKFRATR